MSRYGKACYLYVKVCLKVVFLEVKTYVKAVFCGVGRSIYGSFICQICKILFPPTCKISVNFANRFLAYFLPDIFIKILAQNLCQDLKEFAGLKNQHFWGGGACGKKELTILGMLIIGFNGNYNFLPCFARFYKQLTNSVMWMVLCFLKF